MEFMAEERIPAGHAEGSARADPVELGAGASPIRAGSKAKGRQFSSPDCKAWV